MQRIVRGILWVVKGMLLTIALTALLLWPWSQWAGGYVDYFKVTARPEETDELWLELAWQDGRIDLSQWRNQFPGTQFRERGWTAAHAGWNWRTGAFSGMEYLVVNASDHSMGPIRWNFQLSKGPRTSDERQHISLPCWVVVLLAVLWPLTSLTLLHRRRARNRRLTRAGCCSQCGYDLRATPSPGGETLARCPECGAESPSVTAHPASKI